MIWIKNFINIFLIFVYVCVTSFIILEVIFHILPVSDSYYIQPVNKFHPYKHFRKNSEFTRQTGFNFKHVVTKKSNNYGYLTDTEFFSKNSAENCNFVVIGDSYVEASQLQNKDTFHAILSQNLKCDIYPIGVSGDSLSQYIANTKFALEEFNPDLFIFTIINNDFDESWLRFKNVASAHYFDEKGVLIRIDFEPSKIGLLLRKSAFFRYLMIDLKFKNQLAKIFKSQTNEPIKVKTKSNDAELLSYMKKASDIFVRDIQKLVKDKRVILVLDGDRETIYQGSYERDFDKIYNLAYKYLGEIVSPLENFSIVDLQEVFVKDWIEYQKKFNYEYDFHWNEYGHTVVAKAIKTTTNK